MNFHAWGSSHPLVSRWGSLVCPTAREAAGSWGHAGDPRDGTGVPMSHPQPREAVEEFAEEALFLPLGSFPPNFVFGLTLLFMLTVFVAFNLETLQWAKRGALSPDGVCREGVFF